MSPPLMIWVWGLMGSLIDDKDFAPLQELVDSMLEQEE
jgi:hypothetical protein